jgi:hypothetical protein
MAVVVGLFAAPGLERLHHRSKQGGGGAVGGKTTSHFLKTLFAFLEVRAKRGLSHMMMVHT